MSRGRMTMRAEVSRDVDRPDDDWGRPEPPSPKASHVIPCMAWAQTRFQQNRREIRTDGATFVGEDIRAIMPAGSDIQEEDSLVIKDRMGNVQFGGPVAVQTVAEMRRGSHSSSFHRMVMMTRHV